MRKEKGKKLKRNLYRNRKIKYKNIMKIFYVTVKSVKKIYKLKIITSRKIENLLYKR